MNIDTTPHNDAGGSSSSQNRLKRLSLVGKPVMLDLSMNTERGKSEDAVKDVMGTPRRAVRRDYGVRSSISYSPASRSSVVMRGSVEAQCEEEEEVKGMRRQVGVDEKAKRFTAPKAMTLTEE
jgi:hypothetical protein